MSKLRLSLREKEAVSTYFRLNELNRKIEKHIDYDNGFYVELGANMLQNMARVGSSETDMVLA
ncbi:hypothetical protein ABCW43_26875 [Neorhizobium sp. IRAMC:178]|uniref:hypothetical protein n=1 Tax=Neorhizobium tunisiense TaxID=3144793 RepID=UPI0031F71FB3